MNPQLLAMLLAGQGQSQGNPLLGGGMGQSQGNALTGGGTGQDQAVAAPQDMGSLLRRAILMMRLRQMTGAQSPMGGVSGGQPMTQPQQQNPLNLLLMQRAMQQSGGNNMLTGM